MNIASGFLLGTKIKEIEHISNWEIYFEFLYGYSGGIIFIDSDFNGYFDNNLCSGRDIKGSLIKADVSDISGNYPIVSAIKNLTAKIFDCVQVLSDYSNYNVNDNIVTGAPSYEKIIIAKKSTAISMPFEIGFHWQFGQSMQGCIIKRDGTFLSWGGTSGTQGEYIKIALYGFETTPFNGTLKYYKCSESAADSGEWIELDSTRRNIVVTPIFIIFAIPA